MKVDHATTWTSYQDEETLIGSFLMGGDGGENREHQTAKHQQKTATHTHTRTKKDKGELMPTNDHQDKVTLKYKI